MAGFPSLSDAAGDHRRELAAERAIDRFDEFDVTGAASQSAG
jgi:hypothetical protein